MRRIEITGRFKRDYRREISTDPTLDSTLQPVIELLVADAALPIRHADHGLGGTWKGCRDCHVRPDLVLIYEKREGVLSLVRLGSHSELFG